MVTVFFKRCLNLYVPESCTVEPAVRTPFGPDEVSLLKIGVCTWKVLKMQCLYVAAEPWSVYGKCPLAEVQLYLFYRSSYLLNSQLTLIMANFLEEC